MKCPYCGKQLSFVKNSRPTRQGTQIWRRRYCSNCKETFTTHESIDLSHIIVNKKSGKPEKFIHAKLYSGIYGASLAIKPIPDRERVINEITTKVENKILASKKKIISSEEIGNYVLSTLRSSNTQIFLRFLMYYKNIKDEKQLLRELKNHS